MTAQIDPHNLQPLIQSAQHDLVNKQYLDALNKAMQVLNIDARQMLPYQIAEQAAIELGEFELARHFLLFKPSAPLSATPRERGRNPALPPHFCLPPVIGDGNDYRHILERTEIFKASQQPYAKTVSIIIPTYNRRELLANTLAALTHQTYPQALIDIIVVDDGSHDETLEIIRKYEKKLRLYYARQKDNGYRLAAARNMGLRLAKSDAIIFMDADILPPPSTVETYMQVLHVADDCVLIGHRRYVDVSGITDDQILNDPQTIDALENINPVNDVSNAQDENGASVDWRFAVYDKTEFLIKHLWPFTAAAGGNLAFPRHLIEKGGHVDEAFAAWGCEDLEHGYRLYNAGAYFIPMMDIVCLHQEPAALQAQATPTDAEGKSFRAAGHDITKPILANKCPVPYLRTSTPGVIFEIPKVSIYIPAYNAERYLVAAVQSCLNQTDDLEVVICDDGSTDRTLALLEEHFSDNPRVRWISQPNGGIGKATNTAIRHCRGMYIAQLDADDLLKPGAVQICADMLDRRLVDAVYTDYDYIDETGNYIRDGWCGGHFSREWMATGMIATHFRMFRKRLWSRISGCNETIKNAVDLDLWLKLSEKGHVLHIHQILYSYRWHGGNTSILHRKQQERNHFKVVVESFARRGLDRFWMIQPRNNPLNPREFMVMPTVNPTPATPQDVIFLIPSCEKYLSKQSAIRETWAQDLEKFGFRYFFLLGRPGLLTPIIEKDTLYVPCQDDYEHLLLKLILGYQFLYRNMDFTYVYKIDDDCFPNLDRIAAYILPQLSGKQYAGGCIHPKETIMNNTRHYGKCSDPQFEQPYPTDKQPFDFAKGGYGYFLRRDVLPVLFSKLDTLQEELKQFKYSYEDLRIAEILNQSNVTVHPLDYYTITREIPHFSNKCTVIFDIGEPENFFRINRSYKNGYSNHYQGAVVLISSSPDSAADVNATHLNSVFAYASGFIQYGYKPYYLHTNKLDSLQGLLSSLKQEFTHVIVHCEQSYGLNAKQDGIPLAEALQIPFVSHIRDYVYCPWTRKNLAHLSEWHTLYHTDKLSAEYSQEILGEKAKHKFLPHIYFNSHPLDFGGAKPSSRRPINLLYVGSYLDPDNYRTDFLEKYPNSKKLFDDITEAALYNYHQPIWETAHELCQQQKGEMFLSDQESFLELIFNSGFFVRWKRRNLMLRKIAHYPLTMIWRGELPPVKLHPGTTLLPPANMGKTLELMSESKAMLMMLNSFSHSLSERLLSAMRHHCLTICNKNSLIEESFIHGRDMLMFGPHFEGLEEAIEMVLSNSLDIEGMTHNAFSLVSDRHAPIRYVEQVLKDHAFPPFS